MLGHQRPCETCGQPIDRALGYSVCLDCKPPARWYCFDIRQNGQNLYMGKVYTSEQEIRRYMPHAIITGNHVLSLNPPPDPDKVT